MDTHTHKEEKHVAVVQARKTEKSVYLVFLCVEN